MKIVEVPPKEMKAIQLDDVQIADQNHLVCGFSELGMVDPFSSNPSNLRVRWNAIKKFNNKKNPDFEYEHV